MLYYLCVDNTIQLSSLTQQPPSYYKLTRRQALARCQTEREKWIGAHRLLTTRRPHTTAKRARRHDAGKTLGPSRLAGTVGQDCTRLTAAESCYSVARALVAEPAQAIY
jgi:hypothetical protein